MVSFLGGVRVTSFVFLKSLIITESEEIWKALHAFTRKELMW